MAPPCLSAVPWPGPGVPSPAVHPGGNASSGKSEVESDSSCRSPALTIPSRWSWHVQTRSWHSLEARGGFLLHSDTVQSHRGSRSLREGWPGRPLRFPTHPQRHLLWPYQPSSSPLYTKLTHTGNTKQIKCQDLSSPGLQCCSEETIHEKAKGSEYFQHWGGR